MFCRLIILHWWILCCCRGTKEFLKCVLTGKRSLSLSHSGPLALPPLTPPTPFSKGSETGAVCPWPILQTFVFAGQLGIFLSLTFQKFQHLNIWFFFLRIFSYKMSAFLLSLVLLSILNSVCSPEVIFLLLINLTLLHTHSLFLASLYHLHKLLKLFQFYIRPPLTLTLQSSWFLAIIPD